ncbi:MAG: hypothetical protein K6A68_05160 [Clostridiales bacterium]|nr:hypothetical protein [Clostridiales bacterium]
MKVLSILLAFVLLVTASCAAYLFLTCRISVADVLVSSVEAVSQQTLFSSIQNQFRLDAVAGTPFTDALEGSSEEYKFCTYAIHLSNTSFLPATTVEAAILPMQGDIMQLPDTVQHLLPSQSEGILECTLLTGIHMHTVREIQITYYLWGIPFTLSTRAAQS